MYFAALHAWSQPRLNIYWHVVGKDIVNGSIGKRKFGISAKEECFASDNERAQVRPGSNPVGRTWNPFAG
jgi:hypothetical protein